LFFDKNKELVYSVFMFTRSYEPLENHIQAGKALLVYGPRRAGDPPELVANHARAKEVLGWVAEHRDPAEHITSAWKWLTGPRLGRYPKKQG